MRAMSTPSRRSRDAPRSRDLSAAITRTESTPFIRPSSLYRFHTRTVCPMRGGQTLLSTTPWMRTRSAHRLGRARARDPGPHDPQAEHDPGQDGEGPSGERTLAHHHDPDDEKGQGEPVAEGSGGFPHAEDGGQREKGAEHGEAQGREVE